jgi:ketosteroid isomerase-like protein
MPANTDIIRGLYDAVGRGDVPAVLAGLDANVEWTQAEHFPYAGTYTGPDAVLNNVLARIGIDWEGFRISPTEFIDSGDKVVAIGRYSGAWKATGKPFEADFVHVWTMRNDKAIKFRQYVDSGPVQASIRG